jgi:hypothetical protein
MYKVTLTWHLIECKNKFFHRPNEPVGKVLLTSENDVFGGHLSLPKYKIVECGAFCEVIFFYISPKNLLGDFFYSLNAKAKGCGGFLPHPS